MSKHKTVECTTLQGNKKSIPVDKLVFRPAAFAVIVQNRKILLLKTKSTDKYWPPGGGMLLEKDLEDALRREVLEETGLEIEIERFLGFREIFFYYEPRDGAYHNFSFFYLCKPKTNVLPADDTLEQKDETEKPRWVDIDSLKMEDLQIGAEDIFTFVTKLK